MLYSLNDSMFTILVDPRPPFSRMELIIALKNATSDCSEAQVTELLQERGLLLKKGTIVDSTLISAPSSAKNAEKKRDPEAHTTKKGNTWHFGIKRTLAWTRILGWCIP